MRHGAPRGIRNRHGGHESFGIGMQRVFKDVTPGAKLHDLPEVHNGHPMADAFYDGHIMGNKEEGNAEFFLEGQKEVDDLGTYGYVEVNSP